MPVVQVPPNIWSALLSCITSGAVSAGLGMMLVMAPPQKSTSNTGPMPVSKNGSRTKASSRTTRESGKVPLPTSKKILPKNLAAVPVETSPLIITRLGRFEYRGGFGEVWVDGKYYDLRNWPLARACLEFLVSMQAFDADSGRHLKREIDKFVRKRCAGKPLSKERELRIQSYFNDKNGPRSQLRNELVCASGHDGRFFLKI